MSKKLTLADGTQFDLSTKQVVKKDEPLPEMEEVSFSPKPKTEIRLEDLPTNTRMMNVISAIITYRMMGVPDRDIALALGCSEGQLFDIVNSEAFDKSYKMTLDSIVRGQQDSARELISQNAAGAAQQMVRVMRASKSESNRLRAAEGILNRAGISDANSQDGGMGSGLIIKVVRDTGNPSVEIKVG